MQIIMRLNVLMSLFSVASMKKENASISICMWPILETALLNNAGTFLPLGYRIENKQLTIDLFIHVCSYSWFCLLSLDLIALAEYL